MYIQRYIFKTTYFAYKCCASISPSLVIWQSKKKSRAATLAQKHQHLICHGERTSRASSIKLNTFRFYLRWLHVWICFSVYSHFLWWPFWPFWKKNTHTQVVVFLGGYICFVGWVLGATCVFIRVSQLFPLFRTLTGRGACKRVNI